MRTAISIIFLFLCLPVFGQNFPMPIGTGGCSVPASITGTLSVVVGATTVLSDATSGGQWSSSNTAIGSVNVTGTVTGISTGNVTITYSTGPGVCYTTAPVTVNPAASAIAIIDSASGAASSASAASSSFFNSTGANFIIVAVGSESSSVTVTDNRSNTYTLIRSDAVTTLDFLKLYYCYTPTVGTLHKVSVSSASGYPSVAVIAASGIVTSPIDQQNGAGSSSVNNISPGLITPSANNYLIVTASMTDYGSTFPTPVVSAPFTRAKSVPLSGSSTGCSIGFLIQGTAAATNPNWSGYAPGNCIADQVSIK